MGFEIRMENDNTEIVKQQIRDKALVALDAAGMQAASLAKMELQKSPQRVDTGLLWNSITHAVCGQPAATSSYSADRPSRYSGKVPESGHYSGTAPAAESPDKPFVLVGSNTEYVLYVHEGTARMAPNRFITNAMRNNSAELQKIIQNVLSQ